MSMLRDHNAHSIAPAQSAPAAQGYSPAAKWLHWLVVLLVLTQFLISFLMPEIGPNTVPATLISLHFSFGVLIFIVMVIRLNHRLLHPVPLDMPDSPAWERWAAQAMQLAFYFSVLAGPFLGWASASARKLAVNVFGIIALPDIAATHARWALTAGDVHAYMMWVFLVLIAGHAGAALYHHFFLRDGVLQRMLPARRK